MKCASVVNLVRSCSNIKYLRLLPQQSDYEISDILKAHWQGFADVIGLFDCLACNIPLVTYWFTFIIK